MHVVDIPIIKTMNQLQFSHSRFESFINNEENLKNVIISLMSAEYIETNEEIIFYIDSMFSYYFREFQIYLPNRITLYHMLRLVWCDELYIIANSQSFQRCPKFIEHITAKKTHKYVLQIIPNKNVCKNTIPYNEKTLRAFIVYSNVKEFMIYMFECDFSFFPKIHCLFCAFYNYMRSKLNYANNDLFLHMTNMMLDATKPMFGYILYPLSCCKMLKKLTHFKRLHVCLCEYEVYNDFACYFPERKERLVFLHENVYANFTKKSNNPTQLALSDIHIIYSICNYL